MAELECQRLQGEQGEALVVCADGGGGDGGGGGGEVAGPQGGWKGMVKGEPGGEARKVEWCGGRGHVIIAGGEWEGV